jgi:acyl dehydratase
MTGHRRYSELSVGARFPPKPARYEVTAEVVREYRAIAGAAADGTDIAPPTLAAIFIRPAQNALNGPPGGIHAKQEFQFSGPVVVGDRLDTLLEVRELFERKGKRFVVSETRTVNQNGALVCTGLITQVWGREA